MGDPKRGQRGFSWAIHSLHIRVRFVSKPRYQEAASSSPIPDLRSTLRSTRLRAYWMAERMSSSSRSVSSWRISGVERPLARRSRISITRILIPRMQGLPPHWRGFTSDTRFIHKKTQLLGICFLREVFETAIGRTGGRGNGGWRQPSAVWASRRPCCGS